MIDTAADPRLAHGQACQVGGDPDAAERLYRAVLADRPGDPRTLALLGFLALQREQFGAAAGWLREALATGHDDPSLHLNLGFALLQDGRIEAAVENYAAAVRRAPRWAVAHNGLGVALQTAGRLAEAGLAFQNAWELAPASADAPANLASLRHAEGRHDEAAELFAQALLLAPDEPDLLQLRGEALAGAERWRETEACFARLAAIEPELPLAQFGLGVALDRQGRLSEAVGAYARAVELDPEYVAALDNLGLALREAGRHGEAVEVFERALELQPDDPDLRRNLRSVLARLLPPWHFRMLADDGRNQAYRRAIERAVRPGMLVLDIGTGSGLLALLAARAGAERVIACEGSPVIAAAAHDVVRDNRLADRIEVIAARSTALEVGRDLPRRADLLVSEIVDVGLLGEGVLPTVRHARAELLAEQAVVIPAAATVHARLVELPTLRPVNPLRDREGFDLSAFDRFRVPDDYLDLQLDSVPHRVLSDDFEVARIDLARPPPASDSRPRAVPLEVRVIARGSVHAVALWFELELDDIERISTRPGAGQFAWGQAVQFLEHEQPVAAGDTVRLVASIGDTRIVFALRRG